ncbi:MAG: hypothetical protein JOZ47_21935 [Kutzneria sp.]|nr:hypothetical protein [Kutzneria sp.]
MEDGALDVAQLRAGRRYATAGRVGPITVTRGRVFATVYGAHDVPRHATVLVEQLTDSAWRQVLDQVAAKAGDVAAVLDGGAPAKLAKAAEDVGVRLLPDVGDLEPECGCQDWGRPCSHAAALGYQTAWLLDEDPLLLTLLRGRDEVDLFDGIRRCSERADAPAAVDPAALEFLISTAVSRARELLDADPPFEPDPHHTTRLSGEFFA